MSAAAPEFDALDELEAVLRNLTDELAAWRKRALKAEAQRTELGEDHDVVASRERILNLESENHELEQRLETARQRVADLLNRLRFLEEQVAVEESGR